MRVCGVISEYNPFHSGHAYHLSQARTRSACDYLVAVMSGSFTQRGEPALLDKWVRARMALQNGADLVVELPCAFAVRPAQFFAQGGIQTLAGLGVVDTFCFGSEIDDLDALLAGACLLEAESPALKEALRQGLERGESHARARGAALARLSGLSLSGQTPNAALALEYLRANLALKKPLQPLVVHRTQGYHDQALGAVCSASAIRGALAQGQLEAALMGMPTSCREPLRAAWPRHAAQPEALDGLLLYRLRQLTPVQIAQYPDVQEGLEHRVARAAIQAGSREELLSLIKCKRYTWARLSRLLTQLLLGMDRATLAACVQPAYARVLGFRRAAQPLLKAIKTQGTLPLVSDAAGFVRRQDPAFRLDLRATDLWGLLTPSKELRAAGRDLTHPLEIVD